MPKFRKKPVVIEAVQLRWDTWDAICEFITGVEGLRGVYVNEKGHVVADSNNTTKDTSDYRIGILIPTLEGEMLGIEGDWIIKGVRDEFYPCKDDVFQATYEPVEELDGN